MKRVFDLAIAIPALFLLSPVLAILALSIRVSSTGPALFRQQRLGRHGVPFSLYKFRSMSIDAPDLRNADGSAFSSSQDPRVTPLGRILRASSLDELPQLLNVLQGDMSLVGPRPDQVDQLRFYTPEERRKLDVKPGLTGLAQISGRNSISWEQRKALDVKYVEIQSTALDLQILLRTIPYVLIRRGIHSDLRSTSTRHAGMMQAGAPRRGREPALHDLICYGHPDARVDARALAGSLDPEHDSASPANTK